MAEVFNLHRFHQHNQRPPQPAPRHHDQNGNNAETGEDEQQLSNLYALDFDSLSPPTSNSSIFTQSLHNPDLGNSLNHMFGLNDSSSDTDSERSYSVHSSSIPDPFFFYGEDDNDHMNFVTDLFDSRYDEEENNHLVDDNSYSDNNDELGMTRGDQLGLASVLRLGHEFSTIDGLRVADMDSESEAEAEAEAEAEIGVQNEINEINDYGVDENDWPVIWDCARLDSNRVPNEEFDWEEVSERDNLTSLVDRIEEISVSTGISSTEEDGNGGGGEGGETDEERNLDWEVLLAVNNFERSLEFDGNGDDDVNDGDVSYLAVQDDYTYTVEYDTLFGQFIESESALKGSPPAAKSVVDNLPYVTWDSEDARDSNVVCAVCKDEISVGENVTKLPCSHFYHGDCVLPWLNIRNSCPVCRFELPTDDADYEKRKIERGHGAGTDDLQVRYNFELLL